MTLNNIDINCDVGEGVGNEVQLFPLISSCNIACGGHAGDISTMRKVVRLAKKHRVKIGAHPSYPDRENFGRVTMNMPSEELISGIQKQIETLVSILKEEDIVLHHIKPHGALYNDIAKNTALARVFLKAIAEYRSDIFLYVPYASEIEKEAQRQDFRITYEAFADRNYNSDLSLVSRKNSRALIEDPRTVLAHMLQMVKRGTVSTITDETKKILADTFCIHSDTPLVFEIVSYLSEELPNHHIHIKK